MNQPNFKKNKKLIPVIIQDYKTSEVLMLGYMNQEAFNKTLKDRVVWFWSRSRKKLWLKGEKSKNFLIIKKIYLDCDNDAILILIQEANKKTLICHTGKKTCFYKKII